MSFSVLVGFLVGWYPNGAAFNATVDGVVQMMCFDAFCVGVLVAWRPRSVFVYGIRRFFFKEAGDLANNGKAKLKRQAHVVKQYLGHIM